MELFLLNCMYVGVLYVCKPHFIQIAFLEVHFSTFARAKFLIVIPPFENLVLPDM